MKTITLKLEDKTWRKYHRLKKKLVLNWEEFVESLYLFFVDQGDYNEK